RRLPDRNPARRAAPHPPLPRAFEGARAMKRVLFVFGIIFLMLGARSALAATQTCSIITGGNAGVGMGVSPTYLGDQNGQANEGCTILITVNAGESITITAPNPAPSYDNGDDDNLIGVVNNSGTAITALQLSSATVAIFAFENDGLCGGPPGWTFSALGPTPNCTGTRGYAPAGITYTVTNSHSGIVNFGNGGIPPGGGASFSLEGGNLLASLQ